MSQNLFWLTQNYPFNPKNLCSSGQEIFKVRNYQKLAHGRSWGMGVGVLSEVFIGEVLQALWERCRKSYWSLSHQGRDISGTHYHSQRGRVVRTFQCRKGNMTRVLCSEPPSLFQGWRRRNGDQYSQSHSLSFPGGEEVMVEVSNGVDTSQSWRLENGSKMLLMKRIRLSQKEEGVEKDHTSMHIKLRLLCSYLSPQNRQVKQINGSFQVG